MNSLTDKLACSLRRNLVAGLAVLLFLFAGLSVWAGTAELSSAVIAPGTIVVDGYAKKVQHLNGGVVAELLAQEGMAVHAGDVLARLDNTVLRANRAAVTKTLNQLLVRQQRLKAERDGLAEVQPSPEILQRLSRADASIAMIGEGRLFDDRRIAREGQKARLREQKTQLEQQIVGYELQQEAKAIEIALIDKELQGARRLFELGGTPLTRVNTLDRGVARLRGESGQLMASVAAAKARISEIELQLLQVDLQMREEVASELRDVENKIAELLEQEIKALDQLARAEVRAPISGTVHKLMIHTVGGVIAPAEVLAEIVPQDASLSVDVLVQPQDVDQLSVGQTAIIRLTAFNRNTTPELMGTLSRISPDLETDETSRTAFYRASVSIPPNEISRLGNLALMPGMPADIFIPTGERSVASYFLKPVQDHAQRVFRQE